MERAGREAERQRGDAARDAMYRERTRANAAETALAEIALESRVELLRDKVAFELFCLVVGNKGYKWNKAPEVIRHHWLQQADQFMRKSAPWPAVVPDYFAHLFADQITATANQAKLASHYAEQAKALQEEIDAFRLRADKNPVEDEIVWKVFNDGATATKEAHGAIYGLRALWQSGFEASQASVKENAFTVEMIGKLMDSGILGKMPRLIESMNSNESLLGKEQGDDGGE